MHLDLFSSIGLASSCYIICGSLCRLRYRSSEILHRWKLMYVATLGIAGWAACLFVSGGHLLFEMFVCVSIAAYFAMSRQAWEKYPPLIARRAVTNRFSYTYTQARGQIKTGDMIGIRTGTLGGRVIQAGQAIAGLPWSHITHCAVAMWVGARLMVVEMGPAGNVLKPLSQYADKRMVVCAPPAGTNLSLFDLGADHVTERHIHYSVIDLVRIGARLLPMRLIDTRGWGGDGDADKVCSLLPAMIYRAMGGDVSGIPALAAPAEVVAALDVRVDIGGGV